MPKYNGARNGKPVRAHGKASNDGTEIVITHICAEKSLGNDRYNGTLPYLFQFPETKRGKRVEPAQGDSLAFIGPEGAVERWIARYEGSTYYGTDITYNEVRGLFKKLVVPIPAIHNDEIQYRHGEVNLTRKVPGKRKKREIPLGHLDDLLASKRL